jgi:predicted nucleic acid-binding protein
MKNKVVVDASLALKWVLKEPDSSDAEALLLKWQKQGTEIHSPALLTYEIANILYQNVRKGMITMEEASASISDIFSTGLRVNFSRDATLHRRALELAAYFHLPAAYDPQYLALAERKECEFFTADTRMWRAVKDQLSWVHLLSDHTPTP